GETRVILASDTSASTSSDDMSAIVTTAARELAAPAKGATISPTSAFFFQNGTVKWRNDPRVLHGHLGFLYSELGSIDGRHDSVVTRLRRIKFRLRNNSLVQQNSLPLERLLRILEVSLCDSQILPGSL